MLGAEIAKRIERGSGLNAIREMLPLRVTDDKKCRQVCEPGN